MPGRDAADAWGGRSGDREKMVSYPPVGSTAPSTWDRSTEESTFGAAEAQFPILKTCEMSISFTLSHVVAGFCAQSYLTLCSPMDCSPPGSSVHGILQTSVPEWVVIFSSKGSS